MKIDGMVTFVSKDGQCGFDMLLGRRDRRSVDSSRHKHHAVSLSVFLLGPVQKRNKLQIHNVLDMPRLKKPVVGIGCRLRPFIDALVHLSKMNKCGASRGNLARRISRPHKQRDKRSVKSTED